MVAYRLLSSRGADRALGKTSRADAFERHACESQPLRRAGGASADRLAASTWAERLRRRGAKS